MRARYETERLRAGLLVGEAAAALGVAPKTLAAWESGAEEPYGRDLVAMSQLYGCSPDYLLGLAVDRRFGLVDD